MQRIIWRAMVCVALLASQPVQADELPIVDGAELQPLKAQVERLSAALELLGEPLTAEQRKTLDAARSETDGVQASKAIQKVLDPLCLVGVNINPESRVKVARGPAAASLHEQGWRVFLVKVHNQAGVTACAASVESQRRTACTSDQLRLPNQPLRSSPKMFPIGGWM